MRISLNGEWRGRPDPTGAGEKNGFHLPENSNPGAPEWSPALVPGCWNSDPRYERYEGAFWYAVDFARPDAAEHETDFSLIFHAANYRCRVWLNGRFAGAHEGGYLPFAFDVSDLLHDDNRLVVEVENRRSPKRIPGMLFDWFNYGGIVRDVELAAESRRRFDFVHVDAKPDGAGGANIIVRFKQREPFGFSWRALSENDVAARGAVSGDASENSFSFEIPAARLWSPEAPSLYKLELEPTQNGADGKSISFGVREIKIEGTKILLNGERIKIRGVSLHEELAPHGRAVPREERRRDARDIKALGFNALRTAHYTNDEALLDAADEIGLLVFEEIPVYWEIDYADAGVRRLAGEMVRDMIARDINHPCVSAWSVGNEVPVEKPACDTLMRELMDQARRLDPTRPAIFVSSRFLIDGTRRESDVACVNCYIGWYYGRERDLAELMALTRATAPDKPWIMTEFGACARHGYRSARRAKYSEDRQNELLSHYIRTLNGMDWVSGWFIWLYRDFRSPLRDHKYQAGFNRKGIVSERNEKKLFCDSLPALLEEKIPYRRTAMVELKTRVFREMERLACATALPAVLKSQLKKYNDYFKRVD